MPDYIPRTDAEFDNWQNNLSQQSETNAIAWGIPDEVMTGFKAEKNNWTAAYAKASNKQNRTSADVNTKNETEAVYKKFIRGFAQQWLINNPKVSDSDRVRMNITVKTGTRTPVPTPETFPIGTADFSIRLQHTLAYYDQASAHSNAKPEGVHGCEVFMKADGEMPASPGDYTYLGTCTASPYVVKFDSSKVGKTAYYLLRWVNSRGETGPWSTMISAMIVG